MCAVADPTGLTVYDTATALETTATRAVLRIECPGIQAIAFSPKAQFILTFRRPHKAADGSSLPNLELWSVESGGTRVLALHQKALIKDAWPSLQFTQDDQLAVHAVTNTLHVYATCMQTWTPETKIHVPGVAAFAVSPVLTEDGKILLSVFVPEAKGSPGHVTVIKSAVKKPSDDQGQQNNQHEVVARKSFYRANSVRFFWASTGCAVLALSASDVDATNQSYYGEQKLYFFSADGSIDQAVPLPKDGPVHDVQWNPKGDYFIAVAGFMPAKVTLFTDKCVPKYDLGAGPYSLARWNPFGRFLVVAGFGNLPGDLAFFDKKADGKCKPMGSGRAENGVSLAWSPCGRYVMAATVAPRLRVDNGIQVFKYDGRLVARNKMDILFQAEWQPAGPGVFSDRPQTPRKESGTQQPPVPVKPAGYVPPHLRNNPAAAAAASASFSLAREPTNGSSGGKFQAGGQMKNQSSQSNLPPGAAPPVSKSAAKNAKRRASKKKESGVTQGIAGLSLDS